MTTVASYDPNCVDEGDTAWVMMATVLVLGMIPGLALYEGGLGPSKHALSIFVQIIGGVMLLSTMWIIFGFSLTYGTSLGGFIGSPASFPLLLDLIGEKSETCLPFAPRIPGHVFAVFQMMFAAITPLLQTGSFLGRFRFRAYMLYLFLWELLIYYPVAHWIWGGGFLSANGTALPKGEAVIDFAGGITIHLTSGVASILTAWFLGRRRIPDGHGEHSRPGNMVTAMVGCVFLWVGWFGFNAGSALTAGVESSITVANTQLAACVSGLIWLTLESIHSKQVSLSQCFNGIVSGLAGITPAAGFINPQWALLVASVLGFASFYGRMLFLKLGIDDAQEVCIIHGFTGLIGSLANGFFALKDICPTGQDGWIAGHPIQIAYQLLGVVLAGSWSAFWTYLIIKVINLVIPVRVDAAVEDIGQGLGEHGEHLDDFSYFAHQGEGDISNYLLNPGH